MLIAAQYLIDRARHPRSRADELLALRRRFRVAAKLARACSAEELAAAFEMRELRSRIAVAIGRPECCTLCARKYPPPNGRWEGGYCCGTDTWRVFTDDELLAIAAAGTRGSKLEAPRCDHAGCSFRGPTGCSIDAADRPNICARYLCLPLVGELRARGDLKLIDALCSSLAEVFKRFLQLRAARVDRDRLAELERSLASK